MGHLCGSNKALACLWGALENCDWPVLCFREKDWTITSLPPCSVTGAAQDTVPFGKADADRHRRIWQVLVIGCFLALFTASRQVHMLRPQLTLSRCLFFIDSIPLSLRAWPLWFQWLTWQCIPQPLPGMGGSSGFHSQLKVAVPLLSKQARPQSRDTHTSSTPTPAVITGVLLPLSY